MLLLPSRAGDGATELWCALRTQLVTKLLEDALTRPLGLISEQEQSRSELPPAAAAAEHPAARAAGPCRAGAQQQPGAASH